MKNSIESGLYVVATPIGNLADMVPRAVEILQAADLVAAEDTRHSQPLLNHFGIDSKLIAYHEHSDAGAEERIANCIEGGGAVALISDAGTPLISDPGYRLLQRAHQSGWRVVPIPGPSAVIAALSVAGLPTDRFRFEGFLPAKAGARRQRIESLVGESTTLVFYEAPHRLLDSLEDMAAGFGAGRLAVLGRELTKAFETVIRLPLAELCQRVREDKDQQRGECVIMVAGAEPGEREIGPEAEQLLYALAEEMPPKKAAGLVAEAFGLRKKALYEKLVSR